MCAVMENVNIKMKNDKQLGFFLSFLFLMFVFLFG